jgi:hypothetical protein
MIRKTSLAAFTAAALTLAGCSGSSDETPPADANMVEAPIVNDMALDNLVEPMAPPTATPAPSPTPVETPTADEAQVQDDADAAGMTARVSREDAAENATRSAESVEKK